VRRFGLLVWLLACYAPKPPQGAPCGENDACPSGQKCVQGVCGGAETAIDASTTDDDAPLDDANDDPDALVDAIMSDASPDGSTGGCPAGYNAITGQTSKYRTVLTQQTWTQAEADCEDDGTGTHLATIESASEDMAVDALTGASIWFGLSDRKNEGTRRWVTGALITYDGTTGVSNTGQYDCAGIYQSEWAWGQCDTQIEYVCECDGVAADPTAY